jgi:hypothetical protein
VREKIKSDRERGGGQEMKKMRMRESKKERMINYASIFQGNY